MDLIDFSRYFAALLVVLGLLGGFALVLRKGWLPMGLPGFVPGERAERRLAVRESLVLDPRRRVVIVRSDDTEHVLLLGPERETVLETRPARREPVFEPAMPDEAEDDAPETETPREAAE
ncbi:MAG: flagellar biosynthetic protein FliO [Oceanicaulis sp.]